MRDHGKNAHIATYALQFLDNLKMRSSTENSKKSFLEFTRSWISIVDRGGLIKVNDDMFIFCRRIENSVRTVLNLNLIKNYRGEDIREIIEEKLAKDNFINLGWDTISRHLGNKDLSKILKKQIIRKWVDITAKAYVNAYVQTVKRKLNSLSKEKKEKMTVQLSKKAEPAMRKKLT